jgi:putative ABC transport system substrate-binding protein
VPALYAYRENVIAGGLMSYGANFLTARELGDMLAAFSKARSRDLPVVQSTRFELVINSKTAKTLGLSIPRDLLVAADEVIE